VPRWSVDEAAKGISGVKACAGLYWGFPGQEPVAIVGDLEQRVVHYYGMVQGVGFRYTTRRIASQYAVTGYVQNLPDGRVVVVAEGRPSELNRFLDSVRAQMGSYIEDIETAVHPASGQFQHFDIRY